MKDVPFLLIERGSICRAIIRKDGVQERDALSREDTVSGCGMRYE